MTLNERGRQHAVFNQILRAVNIGEDAVHQFGALRHAALNLLPLRLINDHRQQVQRPWPRLAHRIGIQVVRNAVVFDLAREAFLQFLQLGQH